MITTSKFEINYLNLLIMVITTMFFGLYIKSLLPLYYVLFENAALIILLTYSIVYAICHLKYENTQIYLLIFFLSYLLIFTLTSLVIRPFQVEATFYEIAFATVMEFRLSSLGYFLPILFIPLIHYDLEKFERFLIIFLKIALLITFIEQILSVLGFREVIHNFVREAGVTGGDRQGRFFGMYRIWGVVGSAQLLGTFHIFTLLFMLYKKEKFWAYVSFFAIIVSTSKTAIAISIIIGFMYLFLNRYYLTLIFSILLLVFTALIANEYAMYLIDRHSKDYEGFQNFVVSIKGFALLLTDTIDVSSPQGDLVRNGPLVKLYEYFKDDPYEAILGKGISYSLMDGTEIKYTPFSEWLYLTEDYYILTFFEQYGFFGIFLFVTIFFLYPFYRVIKDKNFLYYIPIVFFLASAHYPPQINKLMMIVMGYVMWQMYFCDKAHNSGRNPQYDKPNNKLTNHD